MKRTLFLLITIFIITTQFRAQSESEIFTSKYEKEITELISQMTLEEKVHQLATQYPNANMRLGIPNITANECLHGIKMNGATVFPQAIAMASTWDTDLIERMGHVVAEESRAYGIHQCYTPMIAVVRDSRWGRTEESYGEDAYLVGKIGTAYIKGLQGMGDQRFDRNHIIATAKHYVGDGEPMAGDNGAAMDVSDYNLFNVHLYPFRMAINEARVGSIMPAHHLLNGIPCNGNKYNINDIFRGEFGWDGLVVSDNGDMRSMHRVFNYAKNWKDAAKKGLEVGIHQELALFQGWSNQRMFGQHLIEAVNEGSVPMELVDNAVAHVLRAKFQMGLFDGVIEADDRFDVIKYPDNGEPEKVSQHDAEMFKKALYVGISREDKDEVVNSEEHNKLALEVAHKSIVLLKNENQLLPLKKGKYKHIAVIGPNANSMRLGGYSPDIPKYYISVLEGLSNYVGEDTEVTFAEGCDFNGSTDKIAEAVSLAKKADLVVLAIGGSEETCRENQDVDDLHLPENQQMLEKAIYETGKPYVVVLLNGRPISIEYTKENATAILEGWYLGQETGKALAHVLFGEVNPSGKLPITFPRNAGQCPLFYNKLETGRPRNIYKSDHSPLFPFGYGLSYTTFEIGKPELANEEIAVDGNTTVSVQIKNTGEYAGEEVVQLYIHDLISERVRPAKELRNFARVQLQPGETKTVIMEIGKQQLEYWNDGKWVVEPGEFRIMVGNNSENLTSTTLTVN